MLVVGSLNLGHLAVSVGKFEYEAALGFLMARYITRITATGTGLLANAGKRLYELRVLAEFNPENNPTAAVGRVNGGTPIINFAGAEAVQGIQKFELGAQGVNCGIGGLTVTIANGAVVWLVHD